jgi:hypothetical protein
MGQCWSAGEISLDAWQMQYRGVAGTQGAFTRAGNRGGMKKEDTIVSLKQNPILCQRLEIGVLEGRVIILGASQPMRSAGADVRTVFSSQITTYRLNT